MSLYWAIFHRNRQRNFDKCVISVQAIRAFARGGMDEIRTSSCVAHDEASREEIRAAAGKVNPMFVICRQIASLDVFQKSSSLGPDPCWWPLSEDPLSLSSFVTLFLLVTNVRSLSRQVLVVLCHQLPEIAHIRGPSDLHIWCERRERRFDHILLIRGLGTIPYNVDVDRFRQNLHTFAPSQLLVSFRGHVASGSCMNLSHHERAD